MEKSKLISLKTGIKNAFAKLSDNTAFGFAFKGYIVGMLVMMAIVVPLSIIFMVISGLSMRKAILPTNSDNNRYAPIRQSAEFPAPVLEESVEPVETMPVETLPATEPIFEEPVFSEPSGEFEDWDTNITEEEWDQNAIMDLYKNQMDAENSMNATDLDFKYETYTRPTGDSMDLDLPFGLIAVSLVIGLVIMSFYSTLLTLITIKIHQKNFVSMKEIVKEAFRKTPKFLGLTLISSILIGLGYLLLIIPGVILTICFLFAPYLLLSEDVGVIEALKRSRQLTKGYKLALYWRGILFTIIMIVLAIPAFILMNAMGSLVMPLFGFLAGLILLEFMDDLKVKQSEVGASVKVEPNKPEGSPAPEMTSNFGGTTALGSTPAFEMKSDSEMTSNSEMNPETGNAGGPITEKKELPDLPDPIMPGEAEAQEIEIKESETPTETPKPEVTTDNPDNITSLN